MTAVPQIGRRDHAARAERNAVWAEMKARGMSYPQIARLFGVHHTTVLYAVNQELAATKREQMRFYQYLQTADLEAQGRY
jgi:chromosomal replication initiation ATPase DnaA